MIDVFLLWRCAINANIAHVYNAPFVIARRLGGFSVLTSSLYYSINYQLGAFLINSIFELSILENTYYFLPK